MSVQLALDLAPHTLARAAGPATSRAAAVGDRRTHRMLVLRTFAEYGRMTDVRASRRCGLDRHETTRRASDLRRLGLLAPVRDQHGVVVTRPLATGRRAMLSAVTPAGRALLDGRADR